MKHWRISLFASLIALLSACSAPKDVLYFQDVTETTEFTVPASEKIKLRPNDRVIIIVNSKDEELAEMVNLRNVDRTTTSTTNRLGYTVDSEGNINLPVLGKVHVEGLTREQVATLVQDELRNKGIVNDAVATVEYNNLGVNVMGEVKSPGRVTIDRDEITILEALSKAGDITINGVRDKVMVTRKGKDGQFKTYIVDLTNAQETFASPAYYLQQDDLVYVEPNKKKRRETTVNGNNVLNYSFWISIASLLSTIGFYIFK